ncbi:MAG TPA: 5-formyltetrahydrofolate cyclo-ligase [Actinomycetota bacterium]
MNGRTRRSGTTRGGPGEPPEGSRAGRDPHLERLSERKQEVRERVWAALERERAARFPGARGRIPNFVGAERAAERLAQTPEWNAAGTIKANPDAPQLPVRARALADGKIVYMAVPRLAAERPFLLLDPSRLQVSPRAAASIRGAASAGRPVKVEDLEHVDLVVCGTVAVNRSGARIGKGGGYSDLEFALLTESGAIDDRTAIATTVHPLQVLSGRLPETGHDFRVDLVVTPDEAYRPRARDRPTGILWDHLDDERIAAIPALREIRRGPGGA